MVKSFFHLKLPLQTIGAIVAPSNLSIQLFAHCFFFIPPYKI